MRRIIMIAIVLTLFPFCVVAQTFQRMHLSAGLYKVSQYFSEIPANCIDRDIPAGEIGDKYNSSTSNAFVTRTKGGLAQEELPFNQAINKWIDVEGAGSASRLRVKKHNNLDPYEYKLSIRKGGAVVGENKAVLADVNPLIVNEVVTAELDKVEQHLRDNPLKAHLYENLREARMDLIDRSRSTNKTTLQANAKELSKKYSEASEKIDLIASKLPEQSYIKNQLIHSISNFRLSEGMSHFSKLNAVFNLNLNELTYYLASDYIAAANGAILNAQQKDLIESVLGVELPSYTGCFNGFAFINLDDLEISKIGSKETFSSLTDLRNLLSENETVIVSGSTLDDYEKLIPILQEKNIVLFFTKDFFENPNNLVNKDTRFIAHNTADIAMNSKNWGNQDGSLINSILTKAKQNGKISFVEGEADLQKMLDQNNTDNVRTALIIDNNDINRTLIQLAVENNCLVLACNTYKLNIPIQTSQVLHLESIAEAVTQLPETKRSMFGLIKDLAPIYRKEVKQRSTRLYNSLIIGAGSILGGAYIIHALFGAEIKMNENIKKTA